MAWSLIIEKVGFEINLFVLKETPLCSHMRVFEVSAGRTDIPNLTINNNK